MATALEKAEAVGKTVGSAIPVISGSLAISDLYDWWEQEAAIRRAGGTEKDVQRLRADLAALQRVQDAQDPGFVETTTDAFKRYGKYALIGGGIYLGLKLLLESRK